MEASEFITDIIDSAGIDEEATVADSAPEEALTQEPGDKDLIDVARDFASCRTIVDNTASQ